MIKQAVEDIVLPPRPENEKHRSSALTWIGTKAFKEVCELADFDVRAYSRFFEMIVKAEAGERGRLAVMLYDKLDETDRCLADREADRLATKTIRMQNKALRVSQPSDFQS